MKKQQRQIIALGVLLAFAAGVYYFEQHKTTSVVVGNSAFNTQNALLAVESPDIHWDILKKAQETEYKNNGGNPFSMQPPPSLVAENKPAPRPFVGPTPPPVIPPPPPPTLPATVKYFGYGTVPNGTSRRAFFTEGDDVYIVAEGETLLGRYRIVKVNPSNLEFEEISTNRRGTAPLVEEGPPPGAS